MRGSLVLLLGVTYKPDIGDTRESPAVPLAKTLLQHGANCGSMIRWSSSSAVSGYEVARVDDVYESLAEADIGVLLQDHRSYDVEAMAAVSRRFFDTRGVARPAGHVQLL